MTALAANSLVKAARRGVNRSYVVKNSQALFQNGIVALDANGLVVPWSDTDRALRLLGLFDSWDRSGVTAGNTSASPAVRAILDVGGAELVGVDVAGVADRTSIGEPVYCTSDNPTDLTLTPTAFVRPVGVLSDFRTTSDMDVALFTPADYSGYGSIGHWSRFINLATLANGDIVTTWTPGFRGRIVKWWFEVMVPATTGSKLATLNIEVGTTNLTGGTIALTSANCTPLGNVVAQGTDFTAGMAFGAADTLSVEAASVTAFVEGNGTLHIQYQADE